ncbi:MAG: DUF805 domain-containing protein [Elusimicrobia bacterium]|nr:DUF805 domain-containing protein [Elusimicrobiota bacterium]
MIKNYINNYFLRVLFSSFDINGCENRLTFFLFYVNCSIVGGTIYTIAEKLHYMYPSISTILMLLRYILIVIFIISTFSLIIRRLHDMNFSGFWVILNYVPIINVIFFFVLLLYPGERYKGY